MEAKPKLSIEEVQKTLEYQRLTRKQQLFISTYVAADLLGHDDPISAVLTAYKCKSYESARVFSYTLMQNSRIIDVLNLYFSKNATETFLEDVNRAIRNKNTTQAQIKAMMLKSKILGIGTSLPKRFRIPKDRPAKAAKASKKSKKLPKDESETVVPATGPEWV